MKKKKVKSKKEKENYQAYKLREEARVRQMRLQNINTIANHH